MIAGNEACIFSLNGYDVFLKESFKKEWHANSLMCMSSHALQYQIIKLQKLASHFARKKL